MRMLVGEVRRFGQTRLRHGVQVPSGRKRPKRFLLFTLHSFAASLPHGFVNDYPGGYRYVQRLNAARLRYFNHFVGAA